MSALGRVSLGRALLAAGALSLALTWLCVRPATRAARPVATAHPIVLDAPAQPAVSAP